MTYVFLVLPFVVFLVSSLIFNFNKLTEEPAFIVLISFLEAVSSFLLIFIFFIQGYMPTFFVLFLSIMGCLVVTLLIAFIRPEGIDEWDLQIETLKNNILLFLKTLLPFYVFMTVFRYLNGFLQVFLSIVVVLALNLALKLLVEFIEPKFRVFIRDLRVGARKFIVVWAVLLVLFVTPMLFRPSVSGFRNFMNLSNNVGFLDFKDDYDSDIKNNYKQYEILTLTLDEEIDGNIIDYYYTDEHVYLYSVRDQLMIVDRSSSSSIFNDYLPADSGNVVTATLAQSDLAKYIIEYDDTVLMFGNDGIYELNESVITRISDISNLNSKYYFDSIGNLNMMIKLNSTEYQFYIYEDGVFNFTHGDTVAQGDEINVISETLFYSVDNVFSPADNPTIDFPDYSDYVMSYDSVYEVMYYFDGSYDNDIYIRVDNLGNTVLKSYDNEHCNFAIPVGDKVFYVNSNGVMDKIEVRDASMEFESIYKQLDNQAFWIGNGNPKPHISNYRVVDDHIEYMQTDRNLADERVVFVYEMRPMDVDIQLPFYAHYGLGILIFILIGSMFSLTDYRKTIQIIDFYSILRIKRK